MEFSIKYDSLCKGILAHTLPSDFLRLEMWSLECDPCHEYWQYHVILKTSLVSPMNLERSQPTDKSWIYKFSIALFVFICIGCRRCHHNCFSSIIAIAILRIIINIWFWKHFFFLLEGKQMSLPTSYLERKKKYVGKHKLPSPNLITY